jgi:hypothetical protein
MTVAGITAVLLTGALLVSADAPRPFFDAICGAPALRLPISPDLDSAGVLEASDDLNGLEWRPLLQLSPGEGHHDWMDSEQRSRTRRFYRLSRVPRVPLLPSPDFRLIDHRGVSHELFREGDAKIVLLVFSDAAGLGQTWESLRPLVASHDPGEMVVWIVNPTDDRAALAAAADRAGVTVPVLHDAAQLVTRTFGAGVSGEALAMDGFSLIPFYRGAIEEVCENPPAEPRRQRYLSDAVERFLQGVAPVVEQVRPLGGSLRLVSPQVVNYATGIAPLLQAKCVTCHRPGDVGSWAMTNHASVSRQALAIRGNILEGLMPPWHADPAHGRFANDFSLTPAEQATLVAWVDAGAPRGDGPDPLENVPPPPSDWPLGQPDVIVRIPRQSIPANGQIPYRNPLVANPLTNDVWLRAAVVKPGNRGVVHHALIFNSTNTNFIQILLETGAGLSTFFAGYVPGMSPAEYPAGTGKLLRAGSTFLFQMHYTPNGTAATDVTELGLYFAAARPASELITGSAFSVRIDIPPGAKVQQPAVSTEFPKAVDIYEMSPHMHYRGDWMRYEAILPDGSRQILLNVPKYDFAWQALYRLEHPVRLPAGSRVELHGGYDNSRWNPFNPDPQARVSFGEQTDDEMFIGYINYVEVR